MKRLTLLFIAALMAVAAVSCVNTDGGSAVVTPGDTAVIAEDTVAAKADSLVQCKGITKRGTQCERLLNWPDTLCFQHKGQAKDTVR